jgi:hypothetical protein
MAGAMTVMVLMASGASRTNVLKSVKLIVVTMTSALVVGRSGKEGCDGSGINISSQIHDLTFEVMTISVLYQDHAWDSTVWSMST